MRGGASLTASAREEGLAPDTVRRYVGEALERNERGRLVPTAVDRLYRRMKHLTAQGYDWVEPASSSEAHKLSQYGNALDRYLLHGDEAPLRRFRRMRVRTRDRQSLPFVTDLDVIDRLAAAGELHYTSIYQLVA